MKKEDRNYQEITTAIRKRIINTIYLAEVGHVGGSLSAVEILTALYFEVLRINPDDPKWKERDIFILSKGHAASALYSVLVERGLIESEQDLLKTFGRIDSVFQVHPDGHKIEWVEVATGSLGQGLSIGVGAALGAKLASAPNRAYVLLGDGECQEGQVWEAAMAAAHYGLDNLVAIVDYNKAQLSGSVEDVLKIESLAEKWRSFGWNVNVVDGHNMEELLAAFRDASGTTGRPTVIIANTLKGKGVSFMEKGGYQWHGRVPNPQEYSQAIAELDGRREI